MSFTRPSIKTELDRFFKALSQCPESFESVSKSAFTQARKKLKAEAFEELRKEQLIYFQNHAPFKKSWKGYRLVSIDGSKLNLPYSEELLSHFGLVNNGYHARMVGSLTSIAYDVCNNLILDARLEHAQASEHDLAVDHLKYLNPKTDILVFDRGYPAVWLMALLTKLGFKFCFRLNTLWKDALELINSERKDIDWKAKRSSRSNKHRFEEFHLPDQVEGLRLVCIDLLSGEKEVLATNLVNREVFGLKDLKELYQMRWGVEVEFRVLKQVLEVEYFTGKSVQAIQQDFYARIFMANMASMIAGQGLHEQKIEKEKTTKHKLKPSITQTLAKAKDFLINLFYSLSPRKLIDQIIRILEKCFEIVRPNRSFPRNKKDFSRIRKFMNNRGI
jgi:hypothetical protein